MRNKNRIYPINCKSFVYDSPQEFTFKEEIDPISIVHFRTISRSYDGSFGFDWLRIDELLKQEPAYKDIIEGGYKPTVRKDMTKEEAYEKLKLEYERGKINHKAFSKEWLATRTYYPPYLNLFSKEYSDTIKNSAAPTYKANLCVLVENSADIDKFEFKYDDTLFAVDISRFKQINWRTSQTVAGNIDIVCLKDFSKRQFIDVYAHPKISAPACAKPTLAGRIIVMPNSASYRKEVKFVFVNVKTNILNRRSGVSGTFCISEQIQLRKVCYQALVCPHIAVNATLDLTNDPKFKVGGKYIIKTGVTYSINTNETKRKDYGAKMMQYLFNKFFQDVNNKIYNGYFTIFSFGEGGFTGRIEGIGVKNCVVAEGRRQSTIPHEVLHGFGLWHTHRELSNESVIKDPNKKYIYPHACPPKQRPHYNPDSTDNMLSYNGPKRKTTWKWQWDIIRRNL